MTDLQKILTDMADTIGNLLTVVAAHEAALIEAQKLTADDIDRNMDSAKAHHALVNIRHWIASLPY
jgi:hypothetical protein